jgi:DNA-binding winged helix-turn-helix (wHTH) protein
MRLAFRDCVVDTDTRELLRDGGPVRLPPKAWELLACLLRDRPRALGRGALHDELWPRTFVSESSLANLVSGLRRAIGDDDETRPLIRTVHGFGYAFAGDVLAMGEQRAPETSWRLLLADREVALRPGENLLGRTPEAVAWVDDEGVSRRHARIVVGEEGATLEDLGSKNGTIRNGERVTGRVALEDGDELRLGPVRIGVRVLGIAASTRTRAPE